MIRNGVKKIWLRYLLLFLMGICATPAYAKIPLVIYSAVGYGQKVVHGFEKQTGIPVKLVTMSTGPLLARVGAELKNPQWNIVWFDGAEAMQHLAEQNLLLRYKPRVSWAELGKKIQPDSHSYVVSGVTLAGVLVVNSKQLPEKAWPHNWNALLKMPDHYAIGMNNPAISGPTYPFVAGMMQALGSVKAGQHWFEALKRKGLHVYTKNAVTLRALRFGEIKVAIVQNVAALGRQLMGQPFKIIYPKPETLLPRVIGISNKISSPVVRAEAKRFVLFLLSKKGQALAKAGDPQGDSNYYPLIKGVNRRHGVPSLQTMKLQIVRPTVWGSRESQITQWFVNNIVHK